MKIRKLFSLRTHKTRKTNRSIVSLRIYCEFPQWVALAKEYNRPRNALISTHQSVSPPSQRDPCGWLRLAMSGSGDRPEAVQWNRPSPFMPRSRFGFIPERSSGSSRSPFRLGRISQSKAASPSLSPSVPELPMWQVNRSRPAFSGLLTDYAKWFKNWSKLKLLANLQFLTFRMAWDHLG